MDKHFVAVKSCSGSHIVSKQLTSKEDGLMKCISQTFDIVDEDGISIFHGSGEAVTRFLHFKASFHNFTVDGYRAFDKDGDLKLVVVFLGVFKEL